MESSAAAAPRDMVLYMASDQFQETPSWVCHLKLDCIMTRLRNPGYEFGEICVYKLIASHLRRPMWRNYHAKFTQLITNIPKLTHNTTKMRGGASWIHNMAISGLELYQNLLVTNPFVSHLCKGINSKQSWIVIKAAALHKLLLKFAESQSRIIIRDQ